mgnify:CR=1 FL=1
MIKINADSEQEAIRQAEIEANGIFGAGWKFNHNKYSHKIVLMQVNKEIKVFGV